MNYIFFVCFHHPTDQMVHNKPMDSVTQMRSILWKNYVVVVKVGYIVAFNIYVCG